MPQAPNKPCNQPGCGVLVSSKERYCNTHYQDKSNYRHTKTNKQRGYGWQWQKIRKVALQRDRYLCQICLDNGRVTEAQVVDHIKPKAKGGGDDLNNLQSLCNKCHNHKTAREDSKG